MQHHSQDPGYSASPQPEIRFWRMQHNIAPAPMICSRLWRCIIEQGNTRMGMNTEEESEHANKREYELSSMNNLQFCFQLE
ncbi:hypothetical protein BpHYR1_025630 [Brachionus plicatilis]|uniref:Uncharacterized protein n=1 Tax=Brachionus plicatilis TaxID=10195 RepID=A0A3M7SUE7_BRAPC|nr:hypothetical protein BpHYR1_025630 [Brachionus plicatilis]